MVVALGCSGGHLASTHRNLRACSRSPAQYVCVTIVLESDPETLIWPFPISACMLLLQWHITNRRLVQWLNNQDSCRASSIYRINIALRRENVFKKGCFTVHQCNLNCPIGLILQSRSNILPQIFIVYSVPRDIFDITLFIPCIQFSD
jgi:hypothetical protein